MEHGTPWKTTAALVRRDLGCALRNPTVLVCALVPVLLCGLLGHTLADVFASTPPMRNFAYALAAVFPTLEAGGVLTLFVMSAERSHGTYRIMRRCGVTLGEIVAAKMIMGMAASAATTALCFWLIGAAPEHLGALACASAIGCLPTLLLFCAAGLLLNDEAHTNFWAAPITLAAILPLLGALTPAIGPIGAAATALSPTGFLAGTCVWIATGTETALALTAPPMIASGLAWLAASLLILQRCLRKATTQQP